MRSNDLKAILKSSKIPQWKIAEQIGVSEATLYRKLRGNVQIDEDFQRKILLAITALQLEKKERGQNNESTKE